VFQNLKVDLTSYSNPAKIQQSFFKKEPKSMAETIRQVNLKLEIHVPYIHTELPSQEHYPF
jgi:hypothetical protein